MVILIGLNTGQTQIFWFHGLEKCDKKKTLSAFNKHCHDFAHFANV